MKTINIGNKEFMVKRINKYGKYFVGIFDEHEQLIKTYKWKRTFTIDDAIPVFEKEYKKREMKAYRYNHVSLTIVLNDDKHREYKFEITFPEFISFKKLAGTINDDEIKEMFRFLSSFCTNAILDFTVYVDGEHEIEYSEDEVINEGKFYMINTYERKIDVLSQQYMGNYINVYMKIRRNGDIIIAGG